MIENAHIMEVHSHTLLRLYNVTLIVLIKLQVYAGEKVASNALPKAATYSPHRNSLVMHTKFSKRINNANKLPGMIYAVSLPRLFYST